MKLLTITNLYPRPDQPQRGMYNAQLFGAMQDVLARNGAEGGGERRISNVCLVPERRLWRWPAIRKWKLSSDFQSDYLPVFYLPLVGRSLNWWTYYLSLLDIESQASSVDLILATWLYPDAVAATRLAQKCRKPVWIKVHGSDTFHLRSGLRRAAILDACNYATGILPNCRFLADRLIEAGVDPSKVHVVPNGVDTKLFHYRSKEEALSQLQILYPLPAVNELQKPSAKIVLFVGNLVPVKGPDVMLEAFAQFIKKMSSSSGLILVIVGSGPMRGQLERQARRLGISDSTMFLGTRPHEEVALWMNVADCLCLTSRSEGMPNVVLESLASGLPVVATDVGGCRETLKEDAVCRLVPAGYPGALSSAILDMLNVDVDRADQSVRQAALYSWEHQASKLLCLLPRS